MRPDYYVVLEARVISRDELYFWCSLSSLEFNLHGSVAFCLAFAAGSKLKLPDISFNRLNQSMLRILNSIFYQQSLIASLKTLKINI